MVTWESSIFLDFQKPGMNQLEVQFLSKTFFPHNFFLAISPISRHCTTYSFNTTCQLQIYSEFSYYAIVCALGSIQTFWGLRTLDIRYSKHLIGLRWVKARSQIFYPHVLSHKIRILHSETIHNTTLKTSISMDNSRFAENAQKPRRNRFFTTLTVERPNPGLSHPRANAGATASTASF